VSTPRADLLDAVREALAANADPDRAVEQQAYMKSAMPYRGLSSATMRKAVLPILRDPAHLIQDRGEWEATVRALWDEATHREERYAAIELTGIRPYRRWLDPDALDLCEHLVRTGQWWDLVDPVASDRVGPILLGHREEVTPTIEEWATDDDLWLRRTAIISQLKHKERTDLALLSHCIEANAEGTSYGSTFWIRKAIGWALRQHARTDPEWVRATVDLLGDRLSGLSRREALKHLRA
jgi:3-methyladenine DNA glycosylase AlkD